LNHLPLRLSLLLLATVSAPFAVSSGAQAQSFSSSSESATLVAPEPPHSSSTRADIPPSASGGLAPFSRVALGVGVSPLGVGLQMTTNINRHINLRGTGNFFNYTVNNINTQGFNVNAKLNLASAGASVDVYPFHAGFRLSPGVLFYNQNKADVTFLAAAGTSFTLNDHTFYSASGANAVLGKGTFGLGNSSPAFTLTTGWGNVIPASGRHLTFPVEVGVAFIKAPTVALNLSGYVCDAQGQNCVNVATDATAQADLATQLQKYQNDFNPLKTFPIVSFGVAYNFNIRPSRSK
jgi:hypothetical protein